jgi:hypothetical protein
MAVSDHLLRHLLLDPGFWGPRLEQLAEEPRQLVQIPRPDLARPGIEVLELRLRAHDGATLSGLLARSAYHRTGGEVNLRLCGDLETSALDWRAVEAGATDLVFHHPPERHLQDRVLDVVRVTEAACALGSVDGSRIRFLAGNHPMPDEFVLAELFRRQGWI